MEKIGLIAGNRSFPVLFLREAVKRGQEVAAVCIKGETDRRVCRMAAASIWLKLGSFEQAYAFFKKEGAARLVMAGQISPARLFSREASANPVISELLDSVKDKRANTIFSEIARRLEGQGFEILPSTTFLEAYVPQKSTLTRRQPTSEEAENLKFALAMARAVADLDIGLSVAVKSKAVVAVEALEGTDRLVRRAGALAGRGFVVAKVARPRQDMRFDIPVIGSRTIRALARAGATCLAIEAGKTLFLDQEEALAYADRKGICVVAV